VDNNPLKYIDPTGHVKVYPMDGGEPHELDVLSPIEGTYRNDNLFYFPESYERLEEIVGTSSLRNILGSMFNAPAIFVIPKYW
jgi:hypothetical protein